MSSYYMYQINVFGCPRRLIVDQQLYRPSALKIYRLYDCVKNGITHQIATWHLKLKRNT